MGDLCSVFSKLNAPAWLLPPPPPLQQLGTCFAGSTSSQGEGETKGSKKHLTTIAGCCTHKPTHSLFYSQAITGINIDSDLMLLAVDDDGGGEMLSP